MREIAVYRDVLPASDLGTAAYYGSVVESEPRRFWLFLEKVAAAELWQIGEIETWEEVARALASLHGRVSADDPKHLLSYDRDFFTQWLDRALAFVGGDVLSYVSTRYEAVVETLLTLPQTFVHGEFYASNVLVSEDEQVRVCPIDWEMAGVGPALLDVAALTTGSWSEDDRLRLVCAYAGELADPPADGELAIALDVCRLHLAVQWLGWARTWVPPREHAHDWLAEARSAVARLGL